MPTSTERSRASRERKKREAEEHAAEVSRLERILHELKTFLRERDVELQLEVTSSYDYVEDTELLLASSRDPHAYVTVPEKGDD